MINANYSVRAVLMQMSGHGSDVVQLAKAVLLTHGAGHDEVIDQLIWDAMSRIKPVEVQPCLSDAPMSTATTMYLA
jgi:hypothetical protein